MALPIYSYIWYLLMCFDLLAFSYHNKTVFLYTLFPPQSLACTVPAGPSQINLWYFFLRLAQAERAPSISFWNWLCSGFLLFLFLFSAPHPIVLSSGCMSVCVCVFTPAIAHDDVPLMHSMGQGTGMDLWASVVQSLNIAHAHWTFFSDFFFCPLCIWQERHWAKKKRAVAFPLVSKTI